MGLTADITEAIQDAYANDLADAVNVINIAYKTSTYDPATGIVTASDTTISSRAVIEPVNKSMIDGEVVELTDTSFLILTSELSVTPEIGHIITANNIDYSINVVTTDPANVAWNIIARAT